MSRPTHVLVQNTGTIGSTTYANPAAVPDGVIAAFLENGTGIDVSSALSAGVRFHFTLGGSKPLSTALMNSDDVLSSVTKAAYDAPVTGSVTISGIPSTGATTETFAIKVIDKQLGTEPYDRRTFEITTAASTAAAANIEAFVARMNLPQNQNDMFYARSNKTMNIELTGTMGTATVTVSNGVESNTYLATFNSDLDTTAADFVTAHAANILADLGVTVVNAGAPSADLLFSIGAGSPGVVTVSIVNTTSDLAGTVTTPQASSQLILDGQTGLEIFDIAFQEDIEGIPTAAITQSTPGSGDGTWMFELERRSLGKTSNFTVETGILGSLEGKYPQNVDVTGQYTTWHILVPNDYDANINKSFKYSEIIVGLESAVSGDYDTFFGL